MYDPTNTFCTVADVEKRLTRYGVIWAADVDSGDSDLDDQELEYVQDAIEYANNRIDSAIMRLGLSRRPNNPWLRDRAIDIATFRVATLGGKDPSVTIKEDYMLARDELAEVKNGTPVPGLDPIVAPSTSRVSNAPYPINF